jgi:hypothetical protein
MSNDEPSRRGFLKEAGLVAGSVLGGTVLPQVALSRAQKYGVVR